MRSPDAVRYHHRSRGVPYLSAQHILLTTFSARSWKLSLQAVGRLRGCCWEDAVTEEMAVDKHDDQITGSNPRPDV